MLRSIGLAVGFVFSFFIPFRLKADYKADTSCYTLGKISDESIGCIDPIYTKPCRYLRLVRRLFPICLIRQYFPVTDSSLIYGQVGLRSGAVFDYGELLPIEKKLIALPYFSVVSVGCKEVDSNDKTTIADLVIRTQDRFPMTVGYNTDAGLFTITNNNLLGYGHVFSRQFFLGKRSGFGLEYEIHELCGSYFMGRQYYRQAFCKNLYKFDCKNLWFGKRIAIQTKEDLQPYYWITAVSGDNKHFLTRPLVDLFENKSYHDYRLVLGKLGFVADGYKKTSGAYSLRTSELLPKGGSVEVLYGYQKGEFNNRQYIGIRCIKNVANSFLRCLHLSCETGAFVYNKDLEEGVLKLVLDCVVPLMPAAYNGIRQFIHMDYITGFRMPKERMLGVRRRDPEVLGKPEKDTVFPIIERINTRLNVDICSTFHTPVAIKFIRFVCLGFGNFIALYDRNNKRLNETVVNGYGIGVRLGHITAQWPTVELKLAYIPLLRRFKPSYGFSVCPFKNATASKPTLVHFN